MSLPSKTSSHFLDFFTLKKTERSFETLEIRLIYPKTQSNNLENLKSSATPPWEPQIMENCGWQFGFYWRILATILCHRVSDITGNPFCKCVLGLKGTLRSQSAREWVEDIHTGIPRYSALHLTLFRPSALGDCFFFNFTQKCYAVELFSERLLLCLLPQPCVTWGPRAADLHYQPISGVSSFVFGVLWFFFLLFSWPQIFIVSESKEWKPRMKIASVKMHG